MRPIQWAFLLVIPLFLGCQSPVREAINAYRLSAEEVEIGDTKEEVLSVLGPTQQLLPGDERKQPEAYREDGKLIEIYYFRSSLQNPQIRTDDEFTPYVFEDGRLIAIGWSYLGGPKTQAQPTPETDVYFYDRWGWGWGGYYRW